MGMSDRLLFPLMGVLALAMIALALVWPQGLGTRSPGPFGHAPRQPAGAVRAAPEQGGASTPMLSLAPPPASSRSAP